MPVAKPPINNTSWYDEFGFILDGVNFATGGLPMGDLSAYWRFDETVGSTAADATGRGNTGTWSGTLTGQWGTGKLGGAAVFNGTNRIITVPDAAALDAATGLTVSAWINPSATQAAYATPICKDGAYWLEGSSTGDNQYTWMLNNGADQQIGFVQLTATTWNHLVLTFDGATVVCYHNGAVVHTTSVTGSLTVNANPLVLGNRTGFTRFFAGSLDETGVWLRGITSSEVASLYNAGTGIGHPTPAAVTVPGDNGLSPLRLRGRKTTAGAPTTGTWAVGDVVLDAAGAWHLCVTGGTPGTWT
jgi:hypothetical protein